MPIIDVGLARISIATKEILSDLSPPPSINFAITPPFSSTMFVSRLILWLAAESWKSLLFFLLFYSAKDIAASTKNLDSRSRILGLCFFGWKLYAWRYLNFSFLMLLPD